MVLLMIASHYCFELPIYYICLMIALHYCLSICYISKSVVFMPSASLLLTVVLQKLEDEAVESAGAMSAQVQVSHAWFHRHQQGEGASFCMKHSVC